jgi:lipopolysaccharide transport system ATP-binding protein
LAFAVAAHLEPEILVVDEVLAVGDATFQKKCMGKMGDVTKEGRTVLFVSHNMAAIQNLCQRVVVLESGKMVSYERTERAIELYLRNSPAFADGVVQLSDHPGRRSGREAVLQEVRLMVNGVASAEIQMGGALQVIVTFQRDVPIRKMRLGIVIENSIGQRLVVFSPSLQAPLLFGQPLCRGTVICDIPRLPFLAGLYYMTLIIGDAHGNVDQIDQAVQFTVTAADVFGTGYVPQASHGIIFQESRWFLEAAG